MELAAATDTPVVLEGYPPPYGPRLVRLHVTPDPGVIEVNVPPASSWRELVALRETLAEEARASRLAAEKFEIDGLHTGTGGGDHVVLGGSIANESPFLRRPWLLGSMVAYFNNHPSLSYLFAGRFIGPTSQAPRIDEARPVNTLEAESRRVARFFATGHTPGPFEPPPEERNPDYACTLDLRRGLS